MKGAIFCLLGLVGAWGHALAEPLVEGRVRLPSGAPVAGAQVQLFDLADLRAAPVGASTDESGYFTLPIGALPGLALPERFELGANYPNPFNPSTFIPYQLPAAMQVRLEVFNLLGQRIATLVDGEQGAGFHTAVWDATDAAGQAVGAGVYLYRLSGGGAKITRSMLLIDGQAGIRSGGSGSTGLGGDSGDEAADPAPIYGLTVSGPGLVPYVDPAFRVEAGMAPLEVVVEAPGRVPPAKAASSGGILGDVDNTGGVDFFDALLVALYSQDPSIVMPNNGDISLGDVNADGQVGLADAWLIAAYLNDPSDPSLPAGIGEPVGPAASLSPDPSTVTFAADGAWHRFTVEAGEPVTVVANPEGITPRLEITTRSGRSNFCPAEADDDVSRQDGQTLYLAGCATGTATVELRREADGTVLRTYTFEITGSPADLVVESVSVSDSTLTPGQAFTLNATVRNQGTGQSAATTLRYYRSSNRTISTRDTQVGTDAVDSLSASGSSAESISLSAPSSEGTYYYGGCVVSVVGEANTRNNCSGAVTLSVAQTSSLSSDRDALVALYNATDGPNWTNSTNWLSDRPVGDWHGVTVSNGRVTRIELVENRLTGSIPTELANLSNLTYLELGWNQLSGSILPELGNLANLTHLGLGGNQLSGSILTELGNLSNLTYLDLEQNRLTGTIPMELGRLTKLTNLSLNGNQLTGEIPTELGNLSNLIGLSLYQNRLTGSVPTELGNLANLRGLILWRNRLTGTIPMELGRLTRLSQLELSQNYLTGRIPPELGQLTDLGSLRLPNNQLTGEIPPELGQLTNLTVLVLGYNQLTGEIPPELGQLTKLTELALGFNPGLSGPLPQELTGLTLEVFHIEETEVCVPRAVEFKEWLKGIPRPPVPGTYTHCRDPQWDALSALYDGTDGPNWTNKTNWLSAAPLGEWYGVTTDSDGRVTELNVEDNNLSGILYSSLGDLADLKTLNLASNSSLSGPLPQTITTLPLERLRLQGTEVCAPPLAEFQAWLNGISASTGVVPCTDTRVDYYALGELHNGTDGANWTNATNWASAAPLDEWYGVVTDTGGRVTELNLEENNLRGPLPPGLGQLTNLSFLGLHTNQLTGEIPPELGQLTNLETLWLGDNGLTGEIPPELGQLTGLSTLHLLRNQLRGEIPPELGQLTNLSDLDLSGNRLTGEIPPELGQLASLERLVIWASELTGEIPPELGQLANLRVLKLVDNFSLTGEIPPELGQLTSLERLWLLNNDLTGEIPPELGRLTNLSNLDLSRNPQLTGEIPPELGQLTRLSTLKLSANQLTGEIPSELGQLTSLSDLNLSGNQLTGEIPAELTNLSSLNLSANQLTGEIPVELGQLTNLWDLLLEKNQLTGEIPSELGQLTNLLDLNLSSNQLMGNIPPELGDLGSLRSLNLAFNGALSGTLPDALTRLSLENLWLQETFLCAPQDADFQVWLFGIPTSRIPNCARIDASTAYLTQAAQSLEYPVPLVAGEAALLRVFVTAGQDVDATLPAVRATFYQDGAEVHTAEMGGGATSIPWQVNEGDLSSSANALVPGSVVMPGLEMVVEIDPAQTLDPALGVGARLPPTGRTALNVRAVPPFDLTLVPFLWTEAPDSTVLTATQGLSSESDLFRLTRDILPVRDFRLTVHEPVWTSVDPTSDGVDRLGPENDLIYAMEGGSGYYMGIFRSVGGSGLKGIAVLPGYTSLSILDGNTIAHELGHNLSLEHSPGCGAGDPDPDYPYEDGSIGVWGYDFINEQLVSAGTSDLMTYCEPQWISDFTFAKALGHRSVSEAPRLAAAKYSSPPQGLLVWGGLTENGEIFLEPAFVVGAPPFPPRLDGPYRLTGEDEDGDEVFTRSFGMAEIACGRKGGSFAFILPVGTGWPDRLERIELSGPEGVSILDGEEDPSATLLLDRTTGSVRGVLRDWSEAAGKRLATRRALPEPGLEILTSRGLPDQASWVR